MKTASNVGMYDTPTKAHAETNASNLSRSIHNEEKNGTTELIDISTINVDQDLPKFQKTIEYVRQIKDPFHYKCGKFIVTARFPENGPSLEDCLEGIMM